MTIRSLHVITSDARRGAETFAVDLVAELNRRGQVARAVALTASGDPNAHAVKVLGHRRRSRRSLATLRSLASSADVVIAHGSSTLEACAVALVGAHRPFVYRNIGDPAYWIGTGWRSMAVTLMLRRSARIAALWPAAAAEISERHGIDIEQIDVIPNAVDEQRFPRATTEDRLQARDRLDISRSRPCMAFVGALSPEKNVDVAIRTVRDTDALLLIAGIGPQESSLRRLADELAPGRVRFLGQVEDVCDVYRAADLLLLPSSSEGMPAVVIEAALVGTPTVATAVGAVPSLIEDGVTGFLAPPNEAQSFIKRAVEASSGSAIVGDQASTQLRRRYSIEHVADLWSSTMARSLDSS